MEKRDNNFVSLLLLAVGVIFILVAGSIFVTTAWHYLPEGLKKFFLLVVTTGLLVVSEKLLESGRPEKIGTALYYLGTGFAGFFVISAMGGFYWGMAGGSHEWALQKLFIAHIIMLFLSVSFFLRRKTAVSLGITMALLDACIVWGSLWGNAAFGFRYSQFLMLLAGVQILFSVLDFLEPGEDSSLQNVFMVEWILHVAWLFWMLLLQGVIQDFEAGENVIFCGLLLIAATIISRKRDLVTFRVLQSILILVTVYMGVRDFVLLGVEFRGETILSEWEMAFAAFFINLCLTIWLKRREMQTVLIMTGVFLACTQPYINIPQQLRPEWYCALLTLGIVLLGYIWYDDWEDIRWIQFFCICLELMGLLLYDLNYGKLVNVLILGLAGLVILLVGLIRDRREYVIAAAVLLLFIALYLTRSVWLSIAWWVYLLAVGILLIIVAVRV